MNHLAALPVTHLHDPNHYTTIEMNKGDLPAIPQELQTKILTLAQSHRKVKLHIPTALLSVLEEKAISYQKMPHPKSFIELNTDHAQRLRASCPPSREMLNGYKSVALNKKYLLCLEKEFPGVVRLFQLGQSRQRRVLYAIRIRQPRKPHATSYPRDKVFIQCAVHGDEPIAIEHCYDVLIQTLNFPEQYPYLSDIELWVLPISNPDGVYRFWYHSFKAGRKNGYYSGKGKNSLAEGVDLNRNFPFYWNSGNPKASSANPVSYYYRGISAASEPETRALLTLFEKERFIGALSYHCYANAILSPYTVEQTRNPEPDLARQLAERMLLDVNSLREEKPFIIKKNLYEVDGTDTDTYYHQWGTLAYLVESSHLLQPYHEVPQILAGLRPLWQNFLRELHQMPFLRLKITDEKGRPLSVRVTSDAILFFEGEVRKSGKDGILVLPVPSRDKTYQLRIAEPGYPEQTFYLQPDRSLQEIRLHTNLLTR